MPHLADLPLDMRSMGCQVRSSQLRQVLVRGKALSPPVLFVYSMLGEPYTALWCTGHAVDLLGLLSLSGVSCLHELTTAARPHRAHSLPSCSWTSLKDNGRWNSCICTKRSLQESICRHVQAMGTPHGRQTQRVSLLERWQCPGLSLARCCQPCATRPTQVVTCFLSLCRHCLHAGLLQSSCLHAPSLSGLCLTHRAGFAGFALNSSVASSFAMVALLAVRCSTAEAARKDADGGSSAHMGSGGADALASVVLNGEAGSWTKGGKGSLGVNQLKGSKAAAQEVAGCTAEQPNQRCLGGSWQRLLAGVAVAMMLLLLVSTAVSGDAHHLPKLNLMQHNAEALHGNCGACVQVRGGPGEG